MSGRHVIFVGTDPSRRAHVESVLVGSGLEVRGAIGSAAEATLHDAGAPHVVVIDSAGHSVDEAAAGVALIDAAWPACPTVVIHDDTDPAVVRTILDAGAVSIVQTTLGERELCNTLVAAADGRGLIDVDVVRPVIDLYATMHAESRRRATRSPRGCAAAAVEAKDTVTSRHLKAVSRLATQLARHVEPAYCDGDDFLFGCLLHDVGKIGVPERILMKPGALTDDEWEVMRRHPQTGARVVRPLGLAPVVTDVVLYHHERWDGRGYPEGLGDTDIPLAARIFSVCDALEAMTAARPYRGPLPPTVAFERVKLEAGHQFDPEVIAALEDGVGSGTIDLEDAVELDVEQPARRRISSGLR